MIIRIDDVSPNTKVDSLKGIIDELEATPHVTKILVGVNLLCKVTPEGSVYPNPPFKSRNTDFFMR